MSINKKPKKHSTKKKVDEVEAKQGNTGKDSPTLTGLDVMRRPSPINTGGSGDQSNERVEDSYREVSVSTRGSEISAFIRNNNDSLILMDQSRPESPSRRNVFDDPELVARLGEDKSRDKHPSEPTIIEEDEPHSPKETTPFRNFRKLVTSTNPGHVDPPSPMTSAASSGVQSQVSGTSNNATPMTGDTPPQKPRLHTHEHAGTTEKDDDEDIEVY
jgi:hypothetical protein